MLTIAEKQQNKQKNLIHIPLQLKSKSISIASPYSQDLQKMTDESPRFYELKELQEIVNNSPFLQNTLQRMADDSTRVQELQSLQNGADDVINKKQSQATIQTKLKVSKFNDPAELEADRVANQIIHGTDNTTENKKAPKTKNNSSQISPFYKKEYKTHENLTQKSNEITHVVQQKHIVQKFASDTVDDIKNKLSYDVFDWAITDQEARQVLRMLEALSDTQFNDVVLHMTRTDIRRLLENISEADRIAHAAVIIKLIQALSGEDLYAYINYLLSYRLFDWIITNRDVKQVLSVLTKLTATQFSDVVSRLTVTNVTRFISNIHLTDLMANAILIIRLFSNFTDAQMENAVSTMDQKQTSSLLSSITPVDRVTYGAIIDRITRARAVAKGRAMEGELQWRGGSGPDPRSGYQISEKTSWGHQNDFARWLRGTGPDPTSSSTMNCWEGVMFMAYKAGVVDKARLLAMHTAAATAATSTPGIVSDKAKAYYNTLMNELNYGSRAALTYDTGTGLWTPDILMGHIVFINHTDHVVLATGKKTAGGRHEVISLWVEPSPGPSGPGGTYTGTEIGSVQVATLEEMTDPSKTVEHAPPPW
ncbi:MAG: hypothetical protein ACMUJM_16990 [bacterium]